MNHEAPIVVIGAGIAGAACLNELTHTQKNPVLGVERHGRGATQASTQNAGLIRSHASNPHTAALARQGARWWAQQNLTPFEHCGSILVGGKSSELTAGFRRQDHRWIDQDELIERLGFGSDEPVRAFFNGLDGMADAAHLTHALLERATTQGAALSFNCQATLEGDRLFLDGTEVAYRAIVIAGGAWSSDLLALPTQAFSRHLFRCAGAAVRADAPWLWDLDEELYLRRDGEGLVASICDEEVVPHPDPHAWPPARAELDDELRRQFAQRWPTLGPLEVCERWAGLRTLTPDDGFILGRDPRNPNIHWCTGLGGHGVTCAVPAARLALHELTNHALSPNELTCAQAHHPRRFATLAETWHS